MQTFFEVIKLFSKFHCLSSYQNDFKSKQTGFHTPIYFFNESIILKNESFCVVCIITYVTLVLLFKDGSNTLHFNYCTYKMDRMVEATAVAKDKIYIFFCFQTQHL